MPDCRRKSWTVLQKLKMGLDGNDSEAEVQFRTESEIDMQRCKFSGSGTGLSSQTIRSLKKQFAKEMKVRVATMMGSFHASIGVCPLRLLRVLNPQCRTRIVQLMHSSTSSCWHGLTFPCALNDIKRFYAEMFQRFQGIKVSRY